VSCTVLAMTFPGSRKWSGTPASLSRHEHSARRHAMALLLGLWGIPPFYFSFVALQRVSNVPFDFLLFNTHVLVT